MVTGTEAGVLQRRPSAGFSAVGQFVPFGDCGKKIPDSPKKGDRSMGKSSKRQMLTRNAGGKRVGNGFVGGVTELASSFVPVWIFAVSSILSHPLYVLCM
jgi:hypothetical protein